MRVLLLFFICCCFLPRAWAQLPAPGQWRDHLEFQPAFKVALAPDRAFVSTRQGVFSVTYDENEVERYSKVNRLSDIGVRTIGWNPQGEQLLIAYNNSNLDVLYRNDVINIPFIFRSNISGDKTINEISFVGNRAYLSTNLGIVVVNLDRYEISSTYIIGNGGVQVRVYGFAAANGKFYAATEEGLKVANQNSANLADFNNWTLLSNANGLPQGPVRQVLSINNTISVSYTHLTLPTNREV